MGQDDLLDELESLQVTVVGLREELARAQRHIEGLEKLRPVWALSDTGAQVSAAALAQIWACMGVNNQTDAMQRLRCICQGIGGS